jgi:hypothetical protein
MILFPALLGLALCVLNAAGVGLFCLTNGCALYSGYSFFGFSFYVYGAVAFGVISLLAIIASRRASVVPWLGVILCVGLLLDLLFLGWQLLYWPCSSCLVVALLLGGAAAGFWRRYPQSCRLSFKVVFISWLVLLIPVSVAVGKEVLLTPWAIYGPSDASIRVFFSPTCPACSKEVNKLLQSSDVNRIIFYPIAKNERDLRLLATLQHQGITQSADLAKLFTDELEEATDPPLNLRWRLARNKITLARYGAQTIPFILSSAVIEGARPPWENLFTPPASEEESEPGGCGLIDQQEVPCE